MHIFNFYHSVASIQARLVFESMRSFVRLTASY